MIIPGTPPDDPDLEEKKVESDSLFCLKRISRQLNSIDISFSYNKYSIKEASHLCKYLNLTHPSLTFDYTGDSNLINILREKLPKLKKLVHFSCESLNDFYDVIPQFVSLQSLKGKLVLKSENNSRYMSLAQGLAKRKIIALNLVISERHYTKFNFIEFFSHFPSLERITLDAWFKLNSRSLNELGIAIFRY